MTKGVFGGAKSKVGELERAEEFLNIRKKRENFARGRGTQIFRPEHMDVLLGSGRKRGQGAGYTGENLSQMKKWGDRKERPKVAIESGLEDVGKPLPATQKHNRNKGGRST